MTTRCPEPTRPSPAGPDPRRRWAGLGLAALRLWAVLLTQSPGPAWANGVSDDRVNLPDGPGSLSGVGENLEEELNMGQLRYTVPLGVPEGHAAATPSLALSYSSTQGASVVGVGWALPMPAIERTTHRGLPRYVPDDGFATGSGGLLVHVGDGYYRSKREGEFVRYRWVGRDEGAEGYWIAEHPDGVREYYGADSDGVLVTGARTRGGAGTFAYHLVEQVDTDDHHVRYRYDALGGNTPLLAAIDYLYDAAGEPRYTVRFEYASREDILSDCASGVEVQLRHRLSAMEVKAGTSRVTRTELSYEDYGSSGGVTRLAAVIHYGADGGQHPIAQRFGYSRSVSSVCDDCERPFMVDMGVVPGAAQMLSGRASLIDINGDALPDLVSSEADGQHRFALNRLGPDGQPRIDDSYASAVATAERNSAFLIDQPTVQVFDLNGDGFSDIYRRTSAGTQFLCNFGTGDWSEAGCFGAAGDGAFELVDDDDDRDGADDPDPRGVRFLDYNNDRRVDMLRTASSSSAQVLEATEAGFVLRDGSDGVMPLGAAFDIDEGLQLADMNGDGLQEPVMLSVSGSVQTVRYRLSLGFGRFAGAEDDWTQVSLGASEGFSLDNARVSFEDVNGDGLDDVVAVVGDTVQLAINRNGASFDDFLSIRADSSADLPVSGVPEYNPADTTVLFADMNANGSDDVVWVHSDGHVRFLELFPVRPNLLARIDNGIGWTRAMAYGTAVAQAARDREAGQPWRLPLVQAMNVLTRVDEWEAVTGSEHDGLHRVTDYDYDNGFYSPSARAFRGFSFVTRRTAESEAQEAGVETFAYDVGEADDTRAGLLLESEHYSGQGEAERLLTREVHTYEACPVADVSSEGDGSEIGFACRVRSDTVHAEGAAPDAWVTTRSTWQYDGYGNVVVQGAHGVVERAGKPCGSDCEGDEQFVETTFVAPGVSASHPWMLRLPSEIRMYQREGGLASVERLYYDGEPFVGLPSGIAERGALTRVQKLRGPDDWVDVQRLRRDGHGQVVETLAPDGSLSDTEDHRRVYTYDAQGLRVTRVEALLRDPEGKPYRLRQNIAYHATFNAPVLASDWQVVIDGEAIGPSADTQYHYDEFGRPTARVRPGDAPTSPGETYEYHWRAPVSATITRTRTRVSGPNDGVSILCSDGLGRELQTRTALGDGRYYVSGFIAYDARGRQVRVAQPYTEDDADCDLEPPPGTRVRRQRYDASGRLLAVYEDDGDLYGEASVSRTEYGPLRVSNYDPEDSDEASPHHGTPTVEESDGLGRLQRITRSLSEGVAQTISLSYDELGRVIAYQDEAGNEKHAEYDLLGRAVAVDDPNAGYSTRTYTDAGDLSTLTDARGVTRRYEYDGLRRPVAHYEVGARAATELIHRYDMPDQGCDDGGCQYTGGRLVEASFVTAAGERARRSVQYDARGLGSMEVLDIDGLSLAVSYRYDNRDRVVETVYPDGHAETRSYDGADRLLSLGELVNAVDYDGRGQLSAARFANGTRLERHYDGRARLAATNTFGPDGDTLIGFDYTRDRASNLLEIGRSGADGQTLWDFEHDAFYRPTHASIALDDRKQETLDYSYDGIDNVTARRSSLAQESAAHLGELEYDKARPNAVARVGALSYRYDDAGNLVERGELALAWDWRNLLVSIGGADAAGAEVAPMQLDYDSSGVLVATRQGGGRSLYVNGAFEVHDGVATYYARIGHDRVARVENVDFAPAVLDDLAPLAGGFGDGKQLRSDPDGAIRANDAWIAHAVDAELIELDADVKSESPALLRAAARRLLVQARGDTVFLHTDHLGSVVAASDADGALMAERAFYPNGATEHASGHVDRYGFSGQNHLGSGLIAYQLRVLDSVSGRWTRVDPKFVEPSEEAARKLGEGTTAYAYVANTGHNRLDPDGLVTGGGNNGRRPRASRPKRERMSTRMLKTIASKIASGGRAVHKGLSGKLYPTKSQFHKEGARIAGAERGHTFETGGISTAVIDKVTGGRFTGDNSVRTASFTETYAAWSASILGAVTLGFKAASYIDPSLGDSEDAKIISVVASGTSALASGLGAMRTKNGHHKANAALKISAGLNTLSATMTLIDLAMPEADMSAGPSGWIASGVGPLATGAYAAGTLFQNKRRERTR